jgi:hypothetical protein
MYLLLSSTACCVKVDRGTAACYRFPEEFSGVKCYDTAIMRGLVGSGYTLIWANSIALHQPMQQLIEDSNHGMK